MSATIAIPIAIGPTTPRVRSQVPAAPGSPVGRRSWWSPRDRRRSARRPGPRPPGRGAGPSIDRPADPGAPHRARPPPAALRGRGPAPPRSARRSRSRDAAPGRTRWRGLPARGDDLGQAARRTRQHAGEAEERHHPERVHVAGGAGGRAGEQLGREVGQGSDGRVGRGQVARLGEGDAEVGDPGPPVAEEDVRRLDVAVDDPARVERVEAGGDVHDDRDERVGREQAELGGRQAIGQRAVRAQVHDDERLGPSGRIAAADVMDRDDVRMADRGEGSSLPAEAGGDDRVVAPVGNRSLIATSRPSHRSRAR